MPLIIHQKSMIESFQHHESRINKIKCKNETKEFLKCEKSHQLKMQSDYFTSFSYITLFIFQKI